jgi:hypothetical protein
LDAAQITPTAYFLPAQIASQNHADDADRKRWEESDLTLLAEFAAKGDARARDALNRVDPDGAAARIKAAEATIGTPAQNPVERTNKPRKE